jgi:hypothetical protein
MSECGPDGEKSNMPEVLRELGERAIQRHKRRSATPQLRIATNDGKWWFGSPYRDEDEDHWVALLFDAFGTRSQATFRTFMTQLAGLCSTSWNKETDAWHPEEDELGASVQIVRSVRPRNEAEACLAAQMVAVHLMQMKLSARALNDGYPDPRSCAIAGKLARTYAMQLETMAKLKGRGTRQCITVRKYSRHEHKHIHLHPGDHENGNQPHEPRRESSPKIKPALELKERPALPSQDTPKHAMPMSSNEGQATVPIARGSSRGGSAQR